MLLSSLESGRITEDLAPLLRSLAAREPAPSSALGAADKQAKFSALLVQLSAYCGSYNAGGTGPARKIGKGGTHRYDLSSTIEQLDGLQSEVGGSSGSGLLYRVEPPASSFATSTDDLQVRFMALYTLFLDLYFDNLLNFRCRLWSWWIHSPPRASARQRSSLS